MSKRKNEIPIINRHEIRELFRTDSGSGEVRTTVAELQLLCRDTSEGAIARTKVAMEASRERQDMIIAINQVLDSPVPDHVILSAAVQHGAGMSNLTIQVGGLRKMLRKLLVHLVDD